VDGAACFSPDYATARQRFRAAAAALGGTLESHPITATGPQGQPLDLTIDVARIGPADARRLVVASGGLHGVEGFFGSAVSVALLQHCAALPADTALLLMQALCPFGFDQLRRADEANIDLNRNFLPDGERYNGSSPGYAALDGLLNPPRPPGFDLFRPRLILAHVRLGGTALRYAVAGGQYEYPRGLFYGGSGPSAAHRLLREHLPRWLGSAEGVIHFDFHTGLGPWATHKLLTTAAEGSPRDRWLREQFGQAVESTAGGPTAYPTRGGLDEWCERRFADRGYVCFCAEFGTYGPVAVLEAVRAENQAHHWSPADAPVRRAVKNRLVEVFAPANPEWRRKVVGDAVEMVRRALEMPARVVLPSVSIVPGGAKQ
jgi:hypothetical protein